MATGSHDKPIAVYGAMAANFVIAVAKFVAATVTGSSALLAEGFHSVVDTGNQALLLLGLRRSGKRPDELHPFGYGQELYFWSLIVATLLFGIGGGLSVYEGVVHVLRPTEMSDPLWNYIVLGVAAVSEGTSFAIAVRELLRARESGESFWRALRGSKDPSVFIVIGEDLAALSGLLVAFLGVFLGQRLGMPVLDGVASLLIATILCVVALFLVVESRHLLLGEAADPAVVEDIRAVAEEDADVQRVRSPLTMHLGRDQVLLNLDVEFRPNLEAADVTRAIRRLETRIRERDRRIRRIYIEAASLPEGEGGRGSTIHLRSRS
ncbi:MAG TPA: cation diffusion facilitator family transporter [Longimicrobiales bacterium]|nr:cation diffusion facilitator family transporter [Longimicrobiales bacterium]